MKRIARMGPWNTLFAQMIDYEFLPGGRKWGHELHELHEMGPRITRIAQMIDYVFLPGGIKWGHELHELQGAATNCTNHTN